jgi:NAD(P)-dependent dehydrogenase (short-subunit alcohol dehydrogenase family)
MNEFTRLENLNGKVAVITGAGGQVGYATAVRLAEQGCSIVGLVRSKVQEAEAKFATLPNSQLGHRVIQADVVDTASLIAARDQIDRCDILVNCASITKNVKPENLDFLTDELFDSIVTVNLRGTYAAIRTFAPLLRATGDGLIVNISSTSAQGASTSNLAYGASKSGINLITKSLGKALAPEIRVVAVVPGFMETPTSGATKPPGMNEKQADTCPLKRIGYGDDVACTIEAIATHIRYATGTIILIDGGRTV